ncbi:MAG: hypothetical protein JWQ02_1607 [Capsulimonas sp.]|jgi:predicted nucleic acid-binding protein|nr:hypothetical protein [Capsulimonas sp.]
MHIFLDSSPLGVLSHPSQSAEVVGITAWAVSCLAAGHLLYIPEVIDYEVRRELIRAKKEKGIAKLDSLKLTLHYLPLTTQTMLAAADLWAQARSTGLPTGDPKRLDIDVILAAQALSLDIPNDEVVIATSNVGHLARFTTADLWTNIHP